MGDPLYPHRSGARRNYLEVDFDEGETGVRGEKSPSLVEIATQPLSNVHRLDKKLPSYRLDKKLDKKLLMPRSARN